MSLLNSYAQFVAYRRGVVHATLNPKGPGAVRIHLVPPRWRLFRHAGYIVVLNGFYILPLGEAWAVLLQNFLIALHPYDGNPMNESDMDDVVLVAITSTRSVYPTATLEKLTADLGLMIDVFFDVACGREPRAEIPVMSLRDYAENMTAPHRMDLMVSPMIDSSGNWNCNLKCRNCYAAGQPAAGAAALTTDQWKYIIDNCRRVGIPQLTFTGGEPTMRDDLVELIEHARWFVTRLNTNGVLLTPQLCEALCAAELDSIQITLYSHDEAVHNALVGADLAGVTGNHGKSVQGIRNAIAAGLDVSVNTPLCRQNDDYLKTLAHLQSLGVRYVSCSGLIETGGAAVNLDARISREELTALLREAATFCVANDMELSFTSPGQIDAEELMSMGLSVPACGACLSNMAVAPGGDVVPCQSWLGADASLGNMCTTPWKAIWNHPLCRQIRGMSQDESLRCPLRQKEQENGGCC